MLLYYYNCITAFDPYHTQVGTHCMKYAERESMNLPCSDKSQVTACCTSCVAVMTIILKYGMHVGIMKSLNLIRIFENNKKLLMEQTNTHAKIRPCMENCFSLQPALQSWHALTFQCYVEHADVIKTLIQHVCLLTRQTNRNHLKGKHHLLCL